MTHQRVGWVLYERRGNKWVIYLIGLDRCDMLNDLVDAHMGKPWSGIPVVTDTNQPLKTWTHCFVPVYAKPPEE